MLGAIDVLAKSVCLDGLKEKKGKKYNCCFFNNKKCPKIQFAVFFYKGEDLLFFKAGPMSSSNLKAILALRFPLEIVYSPSLLTTQLTNYRWDICSYSISDNKTTAVGKSLCFELQPYWIIGNAKKKNVIHLFYLKKNWQYQIIWYIANILTNNPNNKIAEISGDCQILSSDKDLIRLGVVQIQSPNRAWSCRLFPPDIEATAALPFLPSFEEKISIHTIFSDSVIRC